MAVAQEAPQHYSLIMDPGLQRPQSALGQRGVMITEYKEARVNPEPIVLEETDLLLEEYLSPRKLRLLTGLDNLEEVKYLEMKVDTSETSLGNFGQYLPSLTQLKLANSIIASVRDLGSCFSKLRVLWMQRCGLHDLDGISSMCNLKELYLAYNEISDISPCGMLDQLKILDLEGNNIDDVAQIEFLSLCSSLTHLTLDGNPVCITPSPEKAVPDYDFRQAVKKCIPNLMYLDDEPLVITSGKSDLGKKTSSVFLDDWKLINEMMEDVTVGSSESLDGSGKSRPGTAFRPTTGYRPGSALKRPTTARPLTTASGKRPGSGGRPGTSVKGPEEVVEEPDDGSDLTLGGVVCGNPSKALRAKRKESLRMQMADNPPPLFAQHKFKPEHSYDTIMEENSDMKEIIEELKEWRSEHDRRVHQIEESRAPQVLKLSDLISSGEDEPVSDTEDLDPLSDSLDVTSSIEVSSRGRENSLKEDYGRKESPTPRPPADQGAKPKFRRKVRGKSQEGIQLGGADHDESFKVENSDDFVRGSSDSINSDLSKSTETPLQSAQTNERPVPNSVPQSENGVQERLSSPKRLHSPKAKSRSTGHVQAPTVPIVSTADEDRPHSGPVPASKGIFRLEPRPDKKAPKTIDRAHPIIRAEVQSPKAKVPVGPRALTAKAALGSSPQVGAPRIRRQLPQVPSLPSKPAMPK
ncbi:uncharacterized protein LOC106176571 [Lingula anatina]|uniref:Uncharacterized protein LOC106176571 n=1 Tax=Lingula anatina TaxID=7574 RepID=A0A1S3JVS6_LINAN|nr:uncharacterized protein LOC106176571 [Lingula anatina]|eukprot:XP_013414483.1 uncharacterized protein LOC106176571 [Lingula anatina]